MHGRGMSPFDAAEPRDLLLRAEGLIDQRRRAIVEDLEICLAWADLHGAPPGHKVVGGESLVRLGGVGTPLVRDLTLGELSIARGVHVLSTRSAVADALDLRHRLPLLWHAVRALEIEPWVARKVASMTRGLSREAVALVDAGVVPAVAQAPGRFLELVEARIIGADQAAHRAAIERSRALKGVWFSSGRDDAVGLRSVYARLAAADAIWVQATVQRVAGLLAADPNLRARHHPDLAASAKPAELRAAAFGWLARPGDLAELLGLLDQSRSDRARRRPDVALYVHLHQSAVDGVEGIARVENVGPMLLEQVTALVGHANIALKPVIDLAAGVSTSSYEFPFSVRERTHLRVVGDVFPYASSTSRRLDGDHATPYDADGPPGQTGDHNLAPLGRRHHRIKTHLAYRVEQIGPTTYRWTTPHGLVRWVDAFGTHRAPPAA